MIIINPSLQHVPKRFIIQSLEKESTICYGILYGMSKGQFAHEIRMNINEAEEFIENFYTTFPIMTQFIDDIILI
ncbi:unnamed protein product, partial [Rotaria sordida]